MIIASGLHKMLSEHVQKISDNTTGVILAGTGTAGFTIQSLTEWANLFVIFGNAFLVLGGLYFMVHKINILRKKKTRRKSDEGVS